MLLDIALLDMENAYCSEDRFCFDLNTSQSMRLRESLRKIFKKEKLLKEEIIYNRIFMAWYFHFYFICTLTLDDLIVL